MPDVSPAAGAHARAADSAEPPLLVGVGRVNIDPPLGISHGNWGAQTHVHAEGRHRYLEALVMVLQSGDTTTAICDLDLCLMREEASLAARQAVAQALAIEVGAVRLSTSHTHAGPELARSLYGDDPHVELAYLGVLPELLAGAAIEAKQQLEPARIRAGEGSLRYAVNRRELSPDGAPIVGCNWQGVTDPAVPVVRFDALDGTPLAVLFGYAMHPTILGYENKLLSPDYPGVARDVIEDVTGAAPIFLQGCAGDQGPGPEGFSDDLGAAERAGRALGAEVASTALSLGTAGYAPVFDRVVMSGATLGRWRMFPDTDTGTVLRTLQREVELPVKDTPPVAEAQAQVDALQERLDALRAAGAADEERVDLTWRTKRAHIVLRQAQDCGGRTHKAIEMHAIRIGDVALLGVPLELFADVGLRVKARSPFAVTHVSGYTNGAFGYLPNRQAFREGGYEVESSYFLEGADEVLVEAMVELLEELAKDEG